MPGGTLDRVLSLEPGFSARAIRNVPNTLEVFDTHFPRFPVLPGVLVLDSLVELGELTAGGGDWRLARAERVQFRHFVQPGDQLELSVAVTSRDNAELALRGSVHVEGRLVASVRVLVLREEP